MTKIVCLQLFVSIINNIKSKQPWLKNTNYFDTRHFRLLPTRSMQQQPRDASTIEKKEFPKIDWGKEGKNFAICFFSNYNTVSSLSLCRSFQTGKR